MVQDPRCARFLLETAEAIRVSRKGGWKHLDGDLAAEPRVPRPIDLSHPARADGREDFVGTEPGAGGQWHEVQGGF